jgi:hypothetical protein
MFFIGNECVACGRDHPGAHDRACLDDPANLLITKGTPPTEGVERWWFTPPLDPHGRILERWSVIDAMATARWSTFTSTHPPAVITCLSIALQLSGWRLHAFTSVARPRALTPYALIGITHAYRDDAQRTFWLAGRDQSAFPLAVDLHP